MSDLKKLIAGRLRTAREDAELTQNDVAEILGIERASYTQIETGRNWLTIENLFKLQKALNRPVHYFLGLPGMDGLSSDEAELLRLYRLAHDYLKQIIFLLLRQMARTPVPEDAIFPEEIIIPDNEHIIEVLRCLDPHRQRQVYDFARWMLREQMNSLNSTGRRISTAKREEWRRAIEHLELYLAVHEATPLELKRLIIDLLEMDSNDPSMEDDVLKDTGRISNSR